MAAWESFISRLATVLRWERRSERFGGRSREVHMHCLRFLFAALCGCILIDSARAQIEPLILGDTYEGRLGSSSEVDALPFEDLEGTLLDAVITGSNGLRPTVSLYDTGSSTQVDLTGHLEGAGSERLSIRAFPLPSTGGYELRVSGGGVFPASYRCATRRTDSRENLRFVLAGVLPNGATVETVRFAALGGTIVSLDVKNGRATRWNPSIRRVESPTGQHLDVSAHVRESRGRARLSAWTTPAETGEYLLVLESRDGSSGDFTVKGALKSPKSQRVIADPGQGRATTLILSRSTTIPNNSLHGFCRTGPDSIGVLATGNGFASAFYHRISSNTWSGPVAQALDYRETGVRSLVAGEEGSLLVLSQSRSHNDRSERAFDFHETAGVVASPDIRASRLLRLPGGRVAAVNAILALGMPAAYLYDPAQRSWTSTSARQQFSHEPLAYLPGGAESFQVIYRPYYTADLRVSRRAFDGSELQDHVFPQTPSGQPFVTYDGRGHAMLIVANPHPLGTELLSSSYDPALGWSPLTSLRVINQGGLHVALSLAEDGTAVICAGLDDLRLGLNFLVARSISGGSWTWDLLPLTWAAGFRVHAAPGGEFILQAGVHAPTSVYVAGAKGTASWSEWQYVAGGAFTPATFGAAGEFCVGLGPQGTGPYLIAAQAHIPHGLEIHRLELR
ncbi:MAG: hypothetical protein IPN34_22990 [Planctomycetes bacterium]|nr:hypothetical protein [Planctomycetota bacterium]